MFAYSDLCVLRKLLSNTIEAEKINIHQWDGVIGWLTILIINEKKKSQKNIHKIPCTMHCTCMRCIVEHSWKILRTWVNPRLNCRDYLWHSLNINWLEICDSSLWQQLISKAHKDENTHHFDFVDPPHSSKCFTKSNLHQSFGQFSRTGWCGP